MKKRYIPIILLFVVLTQGCKHKDTPLHNRDFCAGKNQRDSLTIAGELGFAESYSSEKTGVYVLEEGDISMIARAWLTDHAEKSIDIQYFIFSVDNIGLIACDYLVRAADRGVKVRIIVDDIMVEAEEEDIATLDAHENIEIKIFNPNINIGKNLAGKIGKVLTDFKGINRRMHNKCFIADDLIAITGGRNIADEYFDYDHDYNFRDRDILVLGKTVRDMKNSFELYWNHPLSIPVASLVKPDRLALSGPDRYEKLHQYACDSSNYWPQVREKIRNLPTAFHALQLSGGIVWTDSVEYIADDPAKNKTPESWSGSGRTTEYLMQMVRDAKQSIDIQSPYLITTKEVRELFQSKTKEGVKIRIMTNSLESTDNTEAFSGYQRDRKALLATGVRIFEYKPDAAIRKKIMTGALTGNPEFTPVFGLHAKTMVIDGRITAVGTFNLDPRSAHLNTECFVVVHSENIARGVMKIMEEEFSPDNCWETTRDFNPDSQVSVGKRIKTLTRRIVPKKIL